MGVCKMKNLTELQCIEAIKNYLDECDADELARLTGELFGGECHVHFEIENDINANVYEFEPNEYYSGVFNDISDV